MIGIMNCGSDSSVEFYSSARTSSLYARKPSKDSRTYTPEGRVLINGVPEVRVKPDDLWRELIYKAIATRVVKEVETKGTGPLAIIRRFSSRLGFGHKPTTEKKPEEEKEDEKSGRDHVTIIRIKTVKPRKEKEEKEEKEKEENTETMIHTDETDDELRIYAQEGILKRLMEEKAMIERQMGNISMEWGSDSGRSISINEESDIVVERF